MYIYPSMSTSDISFLFVQMASTARRLPIPAAPVARRASRDAEPPATRAGTAKSRATATWGTAIAATYHHRQPAKLLPVEQNHLPEGLI
jgi:hypothetical protein